MSKRRCYEIGYQFPVWELREMKARQSLLRRAWGWFLGLLFLGIIAEMLAWAALSGAEKVGR